MRYCQPHPGTGLIEVFCVASSQVERDQVSVFPPGMALAPSSARPPVPCLRLTARRWVLRGVDMMSLQLLLPRAPPSSLLLHRFPALFTSSIPCSPPFLRWPCRTEDQLHRQTNLLVSGVSYRIVVRLVELPDGQTMLVISDNGRAKEDTPKAALENASSLLSHSKVECSPLEGRSEETDFSVNGVGMQAALKRLVRHAHVHPPFALSPPSSAPDDQAANPLTRRRRSCTSSAGGSLFGKASGTRGSPAKGTDAGRQGERKGGDLPRQRTVAGPAMAGDSGPSASDGMTVPGRPLVAPFDVNAFLECHNVTMVRPSSLPARPACCGRATQGGRGGGAGRRGGRSGRERI